jgi:hypothetical protein
MQEWLVPSLIEIGQMFNLKKILSNILKKKLFPLLLPLPTPGDHNLYKLESALCQEAFM